MHYLCRTAVTDMVLGPQEAGISMSAPQDHNRHIYLTPESWELAEDRHGVWFILITQDQTWVTKSECYS